ncbi:cholinesterase-like isoform X2 [Schistocerca serialis cubense]|uniref:cholinesterase-like isoform X2 n=1 Tax=Schistocerca serialis cubense TaxID=2023355 RepID=UPI00214EEC95|nr:cholinesterase-like isoform X2 [Schistocerca serialis cubense]
MRSSQLAFVPSLLLWLAAAVKAEDVLVTVEQGTLQGKTATGVYNTSYTAFLGIPYAVPPLGELRFKAPQPAERWEGVLNATEYGSDCVQEDGSGSEDCLYLNVFVPGVPQEGAGLPVLFWVHGGGFVRGSGSDYDYGPDFLISYDVIFVTINYRLGPLGLFSRLVDQSGSFIARMTVVQEPRYHAFRLGAVLGYETEDSQQLVEFLQSVNATDLLVDENLLKSDEQKLLLAYMVWAPTVEPDLDGAFITESPIRALNEGRFNKVPIMTGVTSAENGGGILSNADQINNLNEAFEEAVGPCLHLPTTEEQREAAIKLRNFYFGDANITAENPAPLVYMNEDLTFFEPADAMVRKIAEITDLPVYYYEFDYRGENVPVSEWGVAHAGELQFLFMRNGVDVDYNLDPDSEEEHVRRNMLRLWTNFGKYGNPTPEADPVIWQPYDLTNRSYLLMQANFTLEENRLAERMDFWNQNVPLLPYPGTF